MATDIREKQALHSGAVLPHQFSTPDIVLESRRLGPDCHITEDKPELTNAKTKLEASRKQQTVSYKFSGTHGTVLLTGEDRIIWKVKVEIESLVRTTPSNEGLFEVGVASEDVLVDLDSDSTVALQNKEGATVVSYYNHLGSNLWFWAESNNKIVGPRKTWVVDASKKFIGHFGFIFDGPKSKLYVTDGAEEILWLSNVDLAQPLRPFFRVVSSDACGKRVSLEIISGSKMTVTDKTVHLLEDIANGTLKVRPTKKRARNVF